MKNLVIILILSVLAGGNLLAQMPPTSKPDIELTEDEATLRIQDYQSKIKSLEDQLSAINADQKAIQAKIDDTKKQLQDCNDALMQLIGATAADVEAFKQKLGQLEGKVREMERLPNDELADKRAEVEELERQYLELRNNKISLLPDIFPRMVKLGTDIKGLYREKKITTYTVGTWAENKDCLWNIAGNTEIYGDPNQWPKIWQANTNIIRNPDIIQPGWVLTIPPKGPKNPEELKAERKYYRMKKEAMQSNATTGGTGANGQ
jgi:nucleoid-associated protein YgaU